MGIRKSEIVKMGMKNPKGAGCRVAICGGNWNNTGTAGVFNVNLNNLRSNANGNIGFRSALLSYAGILYIQGLQDSARE